MSGHSNGTESVNIPVEVIVVTRSKITHHVFVPEEEHNGHGIVQLVHGLEVRNFIDVTDVDDLFL